MRIYIKPAVPGQIVRHPEKIPYIIPQEGEWVNDSVDWQRYLRQGDVVIADPPKEIATKQKPNKEGDNS